MRSLIAYDDVSHWTFVHQIMLADEVRMRRFQDALTSVVRPGDVVADVGTGTGILALLACRAGAARVYAIEHNPAASWLANRIIHNNGEQDRVHLIEADARTATLPESVDVIVCEMIGIFGTDEGIYEAVQNIANRYLKPGGRIIPERLQTYLAPVEYQQEFRGVWMSDYFGLDLRAGADFPARSRPLLHFMHRQPLELGPAVIIEDLPLGASSLVRPTNFQAKTTVGQEGVLQGFVGYFVASLTDTITISNYPCYPGCNWTTWNWPVNPPLQLELGQEVQMDLSIDKDTDSKSWDLSWEVLFNSWNCA